MPGCFLGNVFLVKCSGTFCSFYYLQFLLKVGINCALNATLYLLAKLLLILKMKTITLKGIFSWHLIMRYLLGVIMLGYGLIKILQIQFILPSHIYDYQLKQLDGVTLTWAFLNFSSWFTILLGLLELIPAYYFLQGQSY